MSSMRSRRRGDEFLPAFVSRLDEPRFTHHFEMMREVLLTGHVEEIEGAAFLLRGDRANDSEACRIAKRREDAVLEWTP